MFFVRSYGLSDSKCITLQFSSLQDYFNNSSMTRCHICRIDSKEQMYSCCKQAEFYCSKCRFTFCRICKNLPRPCKKQKVKTSNRYLISCSLCKNSRGQALYQYFHQPKCNFYFCYQCLIPLYENYFKSLEQLEAQQGIRPQFPFQLPCRCQLPQKQILNFLQKSCYDCKMKNESYQTYRLNNNLRLMKGCFNKVKQSVKLMTYRVQKQKFDKLNKMILRCQGCDQPLDSILSNEQNLNVCRNCVQLNKQQVKILEKEKQEQRSEQKQKNAKKQIKDLEIEVKLQKSQEKLHKNGNNGIRNQMKIQKEQQINLSKKIVQPQEQQVKKQQKSIKEDNLVVKVIEQPNRPLLEEVVEPKTMKLSEQIFQNLIQCKQCLIILHEQDSTIKPLQKVASSVLQVQSKDKKQKQNGVQKQSICKLCYLEIKSNQKLLENQRKMLQKFDRARLYKSSQKTQKKIENNNSNIFSRFDNYYDSTTISKKLQPQKLYTDTKPSLLTTTSYISTSNNYLLQKCFKCYKRVNISQYNKKSLLCRDCESEALQKQIKTKVQKTVEFICKKCRKLKKLKQSEVGKLGHCKQCSELILGK